MHRFLGACWLLTLGYGSVAELIEDSTVFVQIGKASTGAPATEGPYAQQRYLIGDVLEGKCRNGSWTPVMVISTGKTAGTFNVRVMYGTPDATDLPNVPSEMLRRPLITGQSDYLVTNALKLRGFGLKYRKTKNTEDKDGEYAPWGSWVSGTDEGDGWVKVESSGYLPIQFRNATVLYKRERKQKQVVPEAYLRSLEQRAFLATVPVPSAKAVTVNSTLKAVAVPSQRAYALGDEVEFKNKVGTYMPAHIMGLGKGGTYTIVVRPDQYSVFSKESVEAKNLRPKPKTENHYEEGQPEACRKEGCIKLRMTDKHGTEHLLLVGWWNRVEMAMKMMCNKLKIPWSDCQKNHQFKHQGQAISPLTRLKLSGLKDDDVIAMTEIRNKHKHTTDTSALQRSETASSTKPTVADSEAPEEAPVKDSKVPASEDPLSFLDQ